MTIEIHYIKSSKNVNITQSCPTFCKSMDSPRNSPGQNTGVGNLSLLQGILQTQGSNSGLPYCRQILDRLSHKGSPRFYFKGFFTYVVILADLVFSLLKVFLENSVYSVMCIDSKYM